MIDVAVEPFFPFFSPLKKEERDMDDGKDA
jgi:hypothetical protein